MQVLNMLNGNEQIFLAFNGFTSSLRQSSPFFAAVSDLAQLPFNPTLLVPSRPAYDELAALIGNVEELGWRVAVDEQVGQSPAQFLLIRTDERYQGFTFGYGLNECEKLDAEAAEFLWREFDDIFTDALEAAGA